MATKRLRIQRCMPRPVSLSLPPPPPAFSASKPTHPTHPTHTPPPQSYDMIAVSPRRAAWPTRCTSPLPTPPHPTPPRLASLPRLSLCPFRRKCYEETGPVERVKAVSFGLNVLVLVYGRSVEGSSRGLLYSTADSACCGSRFFVYWNGYECCISNPAACALFPARKQQRGA